MFRGNLLVALFVDYINLKDRADRLSRNVGNYQTEMCNVLEERRPHLYRGGSLKPHTEPIIF